MSVMLSQITGASVVYSTVCSGTDQRKQQSSSSLAFVSGIHRWPMNCPHKGPVTVVTRKMFPFDDVIKVNWLCTPPPLPPLPPTPHTPTPPPTPTPNPHPTHTPPTPPPPLLFTDNHRDIVVFGATTLRPRQNGCHFTDYILKGIFVNKDFCVSFQISLKSVPKGPIDDNPALVQIMAWCRTGDQPLSEPMIA